jgi:clan AA aspartic protease (TIGR02281 family)
MTFERRTPQLAEAVKKQSPEDIFKAFYEGKLGARGRGAAAAAGEPKLAVAGPPGGKQQVKTHDGAVFTGATVHEAAVFARNTGYRANQIFEMSGARYQPPKAAPAAPTPKIATPTPKVAATTPPAGAGKPPGAPQKPGGKVKAYDGSGNEEIFTGADVHEAAKYAKKAGYRWYEIFETSGARYKPPEAAPATPAAPTPKATTTTTTTPPLRIDSNGEPPMKTSAFKAAGSVFLGIAAFLALAVLCALWVSGVLWISEKLVSYVMTAANTAFWACFIVLLPLSLFTATRKGACFGFLGASFIFGLCTWILGFLTTYDYWGGFGVIVGLVLGFVGIVPVGILASIFHADWTAAIFLTIGLVLTYCTRSFAIWLAIKTDQEELGRAARANTISEINQGTASGKSQKSWRRPLATALVFVSGGAFALVLPGGWLGNNVQESGRTGAAPTIGGSVRIPVAADGHFYPKVSINGTPVRLMYDTGATLVALSTEDARKIGIDPQSLRFTGKADTANGSRRMAPLTLSEITIEGIVLRNVRASCCITGDSLLGMSALERLSVGMQNGWISLSPKG